MLEIILISFIAVFMITYRNNTGENFSKFFINQVGSAYEKYAPYSFKEVRKKTIELKQEYTTRQYLIQIAAFAIGAGTIGYLYFYNLVIVIIYAVIAVAFVPYLAYLRCKKTYSDFIFEQIQVYTTNTIMEFNTTQSFVKSLEGVRDSGVLEDPVLSDVNVMINMAYANGTIDEALEYMNEKYDYYICKNMHQLFLQITKEGSRDSGEALENMLLDIDMLVENVYRDRMDRAGFYKRFIMFGLALYLLIMLIQYLLGVESYQDLLNKWYVQIMLHAIVIINTLFLLSGIRYYNEDVGAE